MEDLTGITGNSYVVVDLQKSNAMWRKYVRT